MLLANKRSEPLGTRRFVAFLWDAFWNAVPLILMEGYHPTRIVLVRVWGMLRICVCVLGEIAKDSNVVLALTLFF